MNLLQIQGTRKLEPGKAIHITAPLNGATFQDGSTASITLSAETIGFTNLAQALFIVQNVGWFSVPVTGQHIVDIYLPNFPIVGKQHILLLGIDSSGNRFADTSSIVITPSGILDSLSVQPLAVLLDSSIRQQSLYVKGFYRNGSVVRMADITAVSTGTTYTADHANIISVSNDGLVQALAAGTDTITVSNGTRSLRVPVTVDTGFINAVYAVNAIDFPLIDDKAVSDDPFALLATASSGDEVTYEILSGPATVENGIVTLTGQAGMVTIRATAPGNAYFNAAIPVTRTFQVLAVQTYTFTGNGNWDDPNNWLNNAIPPTHIQNGAFIYIDPVLSGECVLNIQQIIDSPGKLFVKTDKKFRITGNLSIVQ